MLEAIIEAKRREVRELRHSFDYAGLPSISGRVSQFLPAITLEEGVSLIAEVKQASPVKGLLAEDFDPLSLTRTYLTGGATALSVITDADFFKGSKAFIPLIKKSYGPPVLRKDFIIDEVQLYESLLLGADAVLLIASVLDYPELLKLTELALSLGLDPLIETHSREEIVMALDTPVPIIGINNRNLNNFQVDITTSLQLAGYIPPYIAKVSESGIKTPQDMFLLASHGFQAALVGEALVTSADRDAKVQELVNYRSFL